MTVTIKMLGQGFWWSKNQKHREKVSFENCWSLLSSFASLPTTNEKELFPWASFQQSEHWQAMSYKPASYNSIKLQSNKLEVSSL